MAGRWGRRGSRLIEKALRGLPATLYEHVQRVRGIALELAGPLGLDPARVDLAAAAHDIARAMSGESLLAQARGYGLPVNRVEMDLPMLLHGPVAAERLREELGVEDPEVLEAVRWHTTSSASSGPIAQVVFLADKLDPDKAYRYPHIARVRELVPTGLDRAVLAFLGGDLLRLLDQGRLVHPASLEARNDLLLRLRKG